MRSLAARALLAGLSLIALASVGACAPSTAHADAPASPHALPTSSIPPTPHLASADNFRDVAGTGDGYPTGSGSTMARGVAYRSNALTLSDSDLATLSSLKIAKVIDLRTPGEIKQAPDRVPDGATYVDVNLMGGADVSAAMPKITSAKQAEGYLVEANRAFVTSPTARKGMKTVLQDIESADGPVVFHCTAGKDRAGFVSAILQSIAGVSRADIDRDYMLTNEYTKQRVEAQLKEIAAKQGSAAAAAYKPLLGVEQQFIDAALDEITQDYGSVNGYLTKGIGMSQSNIDDLKAKLTNN